MQITVLNSLDEPICIGVVKSMTVLPEDGGVEYRLHPLHVFTEKQRSREKKGCACD
jgi:hypothetical protein